MPIGKTMTYRGAVDRCEARNIDFGTGGALWLAGGIYPGQQCLERGLSQGAYGTDEQGGGRIGWMAIHAFPRWRRVRSRWVFFDRLGKTPR